MNLHIITSPADITAKQTYVMKSIDSNTSKKIQISYFGRHAYYQRYIGALFSP